MQKRYLPVTIVTVVLAVVAAAGYLTPKATESMPMRILFDNSGGKVVFSHKAHAEQYHIACETCHHESDKPLDMQLECGTCHPKSYDEHFVAGHATEIDPRFCGRCHHTEFTGMAWNHDGHVEDYGLECTDCHHGEDIEPEPQNCADCHGDEGDADMPSLRDAAHARCENCHSDMIEEGVKGCESCHMAETPKSFEAPAKCETCHGQTKELMPSRMKAFHNACMDCHRREKAGPYKEKDCNLCHMR